MRIRGLRDLGRFWSRAARTMSQIFIGGIPRSQEEVARFNRELKFNRELTAECAIDRMKREVLQERKQRELLVSSKRK